MSNRQERKARKERQRKGLEVFVHEQPAERRLAPIPVVRDESGRIHRSMRVVRKLAKWYNIDVKDVGKPDAQ